MYKTFYKLSADPFCLSPNHRFCYRHRSFAKARAYLYFALQRAEGFVMITGAPGSGKTTLLNQLVSEANTARYTIARLNTTQLGADDLLQMAAYAFRQNKEGRSKAQLLHQLETFLQQQHRSNRRAVLIIDEAQDLSFDALEEVRLLTNLELDSRPLLQVFLVGQEQLQDKLCAPELVQLQQRMIAHTHLDPMNGSETAAYIAHRLRVSGWTGDPRIDDDAIEEIFVFSHGVPRRVNQICSRLFLYGMVEDKHQFDVDDVRLVLGELHEERLLPSDDEDLFTSRVDPMQYAQQQTIRFEQPPDAQAIPASPETVHMRGGQRHNIADIAANRAGSVATLTGEMSPPTRDSASKDYVTASGGAAAHRLEVKPVAAKTTPGATSTTPAGALGMAVAHKLEEPFAKPHDVPAARPVAQIHELQPPRRPVAPPVATEATQEPEPPMRAMRAEDAALSRARYQREVQHQWGYALLLAACMLAAALYTVNLDMTATPPPSVTGIQPTGSEPPVPAHIETASVDNIVQGAGPKTRAQQIAEQLHQQGLVVEPSGNGFLIDPGDDATFSFRGIVINDALREVLDRIVAATRASPATLIRVTGHADASGTTEVNLDISQDRADNVVKYLARHGIPAHRLQSQARGAEQLKSAADPFRNRRVEIFIELLNPE